MLTLWDPPRFLPGLLPGGDRRAGGRGLPELRLLPRIVGAGGVFEPVRRPAGDRQQRLPVGPDRRDELRRTGDLAELRRPARIRAGVRGVAGGAVPAGGRVQHRTGQGDPGQDAGGDGLQPDHRRCREERRHRLCRARPGDGIQLVADRHQPPRRDPRQHRTCRAIRQRRTPDLPGRTHFRGAGRRQEWSRRSCGRRCTRRTIGGHSAPSTRRSTGRPPGPSSCAGRTGGGCGISTTRTRLSTWYCSPPSRTGGAGATIRYLLEKCLRPWQTLSLGYCWSPVGRQDRSASSAAGAANLTTGGWFSCLVCAAIAIRLSLPSARCVLRYSSSGHHRRLPRPRRLSAVPRWTSAQAELEWGIQQVPKGSAAQRSATPPTNPFVALLPDPGQVDMSTWRATMAAGGQRREQSRRSPANPLKVREAERANTHLNDTAKVAQRIRQFGTGKREHAAAAISGVLAPRNATVVIPQSPEDNGSIPLAGDLGLSRSRVTQISAHIGDGPHGSGMWFRNEITSTCINFIYNFHWRPTVWSFARFPFISL